MARRTRLRQGRILVACGIVAAKDEFAVRSLQPLPWFVVIFLDPMSREFLEALEEAEHEQLQILQEPELGLFALIAIHNTRRGPAFGGIRRFAYRSGAQALRDVLRLARAMTYKCVMAGVPGGGGKSVIVDCPELNTEAAYRLLGRYIENLGGRYYTGPDVGTGPEELGWLSESTSFVTSPGPDGPGDLAEASARGVMAGIRAVLRHLGRREASGNGNVDLGGLRFMIQGLGEVGSKLARRLLDGGARVCCSEIDQDLIERAVDELGIEAIAPGEAYQVDCDILVPCAMGGILHDLTATRLRCKAVAGSANNLFASPEHALVFAKRGILVAPDYIINSGALIQGAQFHLTGNRDQDQAIDRIEDELFALFERSKREAIAPSDLADRIAEERLAKSAQRPYFPKTSFPSSGR